MSAPLDADGRLTLNHISAGRVAGVERTLCGLEIPKSAQPAPREASWCLQCKELDA